MNLVLAGSVDQSLGNRAVELTKPKRVVILPSGSWRLNGARDEAEIRFAVSELCKLGRIDHAYIEENFRFSRLKLLAMDMDSTLITIECIDEIADYLGKKREIAAITEAAMRGEIQDFAESLRRRVALLEGANVNVLRQVFDERLRLTSGAEELIGAAQANGIETLLVSGGFTYFTERLQKSLGLTYTFANQLLVKDGHLTGFITEPPFDAAGKAERVDNALRRLGATREHALAVGDGANDVLMMSRVKHSVAYRGKPALQAITKYAVNYGSLKTVLDIFAYNGS